MTIASAQAPVGGDPRANGEAVRAAMAAARRQGARLVHFTEGAVCGYVPDPLAADPEAVRRELRGIAALAGRLGVWVVVGAVHYLTPPHRPHNSLYVISDEGRLAGRYDKRYCSHTEIAERYTPGFRPLVFEVDGFRFGCVLCIEVNFPEVFLDYRARDVDCVLFSSFSDDPVFETLARAHAAAHGSWVSVAVPAQFSHVMPAGLIGPHGRRLAGGPDDGAAAVVTAVLDPADPALDTALDKARPWRARAREGEIYRARRVVDPRSSDRMSF
ncbi:carbon-nitrogen hydrolase family protein [Spirillospora sp. NPDC050679]